jgi:hypothetical protein
MCRNIKKLRQDEALPSEEELHLAALQFVRKVSGYRVPSRRNSAAFDEAVLEIAGSTRRLLERLGTAAPSPRASRPSGKEARVRA